MELIAYRVLHDPASLRVAPVAREWMDGSLQRAPYRCLPMTIANAHGWEILCPYTIQLAWNGRRDARDIRLTCPEGDARGDDQPMIVSHFGEGVVTFRPGYLFVTDPDYCLYVSGPINRPKDGIAPLTGIVETGWLPYTFTMNWRFTRPTTVLFEKDEPMCHIFPVQPDLVERVQPEVRDLQSNPELADRYATWRESRDSFIDDMRVGAGTARSEGWQRRYLKGTDAEGCPMAIAHRTRLALRAFAGRATDEREP